MKKIVILPNRSNAHLESISRIASANHLRPLFIQRARLLLQHERKQSKSNTRFRQAKRPSSSRNLSKHKQPYGQQTKISVINHKSSRWV